MKALRWNIYGNLSASAKVRALSVVRQLMRMKQNYNLPVLQKSWTDGTYFFTLKLSNVMNIIHVTSDLAKAIQFWVYADGQAWGLFGSDSWGKTKIKDLALMPPAFNTTWTDGTNIVVGGYSTRKTAQPFFCQWKTPLTHASGYGLVTDYARIGATVGVAGGIAETFDERFWSNDGHGVFPVIEDAVDSTARDDGRFASGGVATLNKVTAYFNGIEVESEASSIKDVFMAAYGDSLLLGSYFFANPADPTYSYRVYTFDGKAVTGSVDYPVTIPSNVSLTTWAGELSPAKWAFMPYQFNRTGTAVVGALVPIDASDFVLASGLNVLITFDHNTQTAEMVRLDTNYTRNTAQTAFSSTGDYPPEEMPSLGNGDSWSEIYSTLTTTDQIHALNGYVFKEDVLVRIQIKSTLREIQDYNYSFIGTNWSIGAIAFASSSLQISSETARKYLVSVTMSDVTIVADAGVKVPNFGLENSLVSHVGEEGVAAWSLDKTTAYSEITYDSGNVYSKLEYARRPSILFYGLHPETGAFDIAVVDAVELYSDPNEKPVFYAGPPGTFLSGYYLSGERVQSKRFVEYIRMPDGTNNTEASTSTITIKGGQKGAAVTSSEPSIEVMTQGGVRNLPYNRIKNFNNLRVWNRFPYGAMGVYLPNSIGHRFLEDRNQNILTFIPKMQDAYQWLAGYQDLFVTQIGSTAWSWGGAEPEKWRVSRPTIFGLYDVDGNAIDLSNLNFTEIEAIGACDGFKAGA